MEAQAPQAHLKRATERAIHGATVPSWASAASSVHAVLLPIAPSEPPASCHTA